MLILFIIAQSAATQTITVGQLLGILVAVVGGGAALTAYLIRWLVNVSDIRTNIMLQAQRLDTLEVDHRAMRQTLHDIRNSLQSIDVRIVEIATQMGIDNVDHSGGRRSSDQGR